MRIRFIKNTELYHKGLSYDITKSAALEFIRRGLAIADKMMDRNREK